MVSRQSSESLAAERDRLKQMLEKKHSQAKSNYWITGVGIVLFIIGYANYDAGNVLGLGAFVGAVIGFIGIVGFFQYFSSTKELVEKIKACQSILDDRNSG